MKHVLTFLILTIIFVAVTGAQIKQLEIPLDYPNEGPTPFNYRIISADRVLITGYNSTKCYSLTSGVELWSVPFGGSFAFESNRDVYLKSSEEIRRYKADGTMVDGTLVWTVSSPTKYVSEFGYRINVDRQGFIFDYDDSSFTLRKFNRWGVKLWETVLPVEGTPTNPQYPFIGMRWDHWSNTYLAYYDKYLPADQASYAVSVAVIKYSADGTILWKRSWPTSSCKVKKLSSRSQTKIDSTTMEWKPLSSNSFVVNDDGFSYLGATQLSTVYSSKIKSNGSGFIDEKRTNTWRIQVTNPKGKTKQLLLQGKGKFITQETNGGVTSTLTEQLNQYKGMWLTYENATAYFQGIYDTRRNDKGPLVGKFDTVLVQIKNGIVKWTRAVNADFNNRFFDWYDNSYFLSKYNETQSSVVKVSAKGKVTISPDLYSSSLHDIIGLRSDHRGFLTGIQVQPNFAYVQFEYDSFLEWNPKTSHQQINTQIHQFELTNNYPNPFNPTTTISYSIPVDGMVTLTIFNTLGQEVETLVNEFREAGYNSVTWDASNQPSGMYYYKLQAGNFSDTKKLMLIR